MKINLFNFLSRIKRLKEPAIDILIDALAGLLTILFLCGMVFLFNYFATPIIIFIICVLAGMLVRSVFFKPK
jgi:hypothetical protein